MRKNVLLLVLLVICQVALAAQAQAPPAAPQAGTLPDTPAGRQVAAWLRAVNSGEPATIRSFVAEHYAKSALERRPLADRVEGLSELYQDTLGYDFRRVEAAGERDITVLVQDKLAGDWVSLRLEIEANAPYGILGVRIDNAVQPPGAASRGKLSDEEISRQLQVYLEKLVAADRFSGAVLVARNAKPIYRAAYGLASKAFSVPNRIDTKFNLGSMNKMVTAVAIAQLAEQGKLSFDDKVGKFLPDYPNADVREKVTIHQLLTHTSGVANYFNEKYVQGAKERFRTVQDFLNLFADRPPAFEPGSQWRYSNGGFMLLGAIVEKVAGQNYFDYVRQHIYKPAGMINTDAYEMDRDTPNLAIGYTRECPGGRSAPGERCNNLYLHVVKGGPAGGGFSTVEDLVKFAEALRGNKLLSAKYTDIVTTGKIHPNPEFQDHQYAYGFGDRRENGARIVGHNGGFAGINGQLDIYLDGSGCTVAVLSNYDPDAAGRVARKARQLLAQK